MTSFEVRKKFIDFFKRHQHTVLPGSSLIPDNDPSLLFVNAGMNQFKDIFLGLKPPPDKNVATIQKCLRAGGKHNDLEAVGETPLHHTFFEMLGNFSFGGYFKSKAIALAWEFLTVDLKLDPKDLWISVYEKDEESYTIWRDEQNIPENKIYRMGDKDNFWQMGDTGPCGPCTEIHYYKGKEKRPDPNQFMEIWNLVFMEFYDTEGGKRQKLSVPCVDTGMGLERLCALLQNKKSNYHTDLFSEIILSLEKASGCPYDFEEREQTDRQKAFRVLADHSRAIVFLINDGVIPGNDRENYVLRRIIRRALYYSQKLNPEKNLLQIGVEKTISLMAETGSLLKQDKELLNIAETYLSLKQEERQTQSIINGEAGLFFDSLKAGKKQLEKVMKVQSKPHLNAPEVWNLYSTYGFPMDLTRLMAKEEGWTVAKEEDIKRYEEKAKQQIKEGLSDILQEKVKNFAPQLIPEIQRKMKERSREKIKIEEQQNINSYAQKQDVFLKSQEEKLETFFSGYEKAKETGQILLTVSFDTSAAASLNKGGYTLSNRLSLKPLEKNQKGWLVLDKSCFYPEGGGAIGDRGFLKTETGAAEILDCQKEGSFIWHEVKVLEGQLKEDQQGQMEVNINHRKEISASHTATHLLNSALRSVLGKSVRQAGSLVEPGRLRFDFTHPQSLNQKQIKGIEEQVLKHIHQSEEVTPSHKNFQQAQKEDYIYLKGENYPEKVRVLKIGEKTSKELCGGIHVKNTGEIKHFKIISEKGIQSGVRRIVAYTGSLAKAWESFLIKENLQLRKYLNLPLPEKENIREKQNPFVSWIEGKEKELKALRKSIVRLEQNKDSQNTISKNESWVKVEYPFHPLAFQMLELREYLKLPLPESDRVIEYLLEQSYLDKKIILKESSSKFNEKANDSAHTNKPSSQTAEDFFKEVESPLDVLKAREREVKKLYDQWEKLKQLNLTKNKLLERAKDFEIKGIKGKLLVVEFPLSDRKILSDISDFLLSKLSSGLVVLSGEGEGQHPVFVNRTKSFEKLLSAGGILKNTIAPLCKGKGGGKDSFAQGSITDKSEFTKIEQMLLNG